MKSSKVSAAKNYMRLAEERLELHQKNTEDVEQARDHLKKAIEELEKELED